MIGPYFEELSTQFEGVVFLKVNLTSVQRFKGRLIVALCSVCKGRLLGVLLR